MLYCYKDFNPNTDLFYYASTFAAWKTSIDSDYSPISITIDNYRINDNEAKIKSTLTDSDFDNISYIIEYDSVSGYYRCYNVLNSKRESGFYVYALKVDLWATYIFKMNMRKLFVQRCNRDLGTGTFDNIGLLTDEGTWNLFSTDEQDSTHETAILVKIKASFNNFPILQTGSNTNEIYMICKTSEISKLYGEGAVVQNSFNKIARVISNIYAMTSSNAADDNVAVYNAQPLEAYILPWNFYDDVLNANYRKLCISTGAFLETLSGSTIELHHLNGIFTKEVNLTLANDPNKKYRVGTKYNNMELIQTNDNSNFSIIEYLSPTDFKITVKQGDNELDITNAFKIPIFVNDLNTNALNDIKNILQFIPKVISYTKNSNFTDSLNLGAQMISMANSKNVQSGSGVSEGNAGITFSKTNTKLYRQPFGYWSYTSINDEQENAAIHGIYYKIDLTDLSDIFSEPYLYPLLENTTTYLKADCIIENLPLNAQQFIKEKLANGIFINYVS